jgi:hypothetical protein
MEKLKAQWSALPQWQKLIILLVLPIAIIGYTYVMLINPLIKNLEESKKQKEELTRSIEELKRLANPKALEPLRKQRDELKAQLEVKKQELELVVGEIPSTKDTGTIYKKFGAIASESSINLAQPNEVGYTLEKTPEGRAVVKIVREQTQQQGRQQQQKPQEQKQQQPSDVVKHPTAELKISFVGSYANIVNFLKSLEKGGFVSYPSAFKVDRSEKGMLKGDLTILIIMKEEKIYVE